MANNLARNAKAAVGSLLAISTLVTAVPAAAQDRGGHRGRHHDGINAGEVIAGAIVIGGLAAILSGGNNGRYDRRDRDYDRYDSNYDGYDWDRYGGSREAIQRCINAVERRGGGRNDIDVRRVTGVDRIRAGYRITGTVAADYNDRWGRDRYDRDDRYDRQRYDDRGRFSCTVRYGRVDDVNLRGI